jgi:hypothetical protein
VNDPLLVYLAVFSVVTLTCGVLAVAWTRGRLGVVAAIMLGVWLVVWLTDLAAVSSGFRDTDRFADCGAECTGAHYLAAVGFLAPPLLVALTALTALAGVIALMRRWSVRIG